MVAGPDTSLTCPPARRPTCVFVGLGSWGRRMVPRVARVFDIVAMVNKGGSESTAWHAERYCEVPLFTNLDHALSRRPVDAVFIATPTPTHAALACRALDAGCHVFVEKPLALAPGEAARTVSLAERNGLELFIGYIYLFHPGFRFLRDLSRTNPIRSLRFEWIRPRLSGSLHGELLCHDLAVTIGLTDELPERIITLRASERSLHCQAYLTSQCSYESIIELRDATKYRSVTAVYDDGATYVWQNDTVYSLANPGVDLLGEPDTEDPLSQEIAAFLSAIWSGRRIPADRRFSVGIAERLSEVDRSTTPP
jgi:Predicted dehydrogenases and related proteins